MIMVLTTKILIALIGSKLIRYLIAMMKMKTKCQINFQANRVILIFIPHLF